MAGYGTGFTALGIPIPEGETPLAQDVKKIISAVVPKVLTTLGVGGAGVLDYVTGTNLMGGIAPEFEKAWGLGNKPSGATREIPMPTPAPISVAPATVNTPAAAVAAPVPVAAPHPLSRYKTVYDALRDLPDAKFKRFVDGAGDSVPGIGYVETVDPKTGKPRMERVIENPADKTQEPMTLGQAEVAARIMAGVGAREETRARTGVEREKLNLEERKYEDQFDMTKPENILKLAALVAPKMSKKTFGDEGDEVTETAPDLRAGYESLAGLGVKGIPPLPEKKRDWNKFWLNASLSAKEDPKKTARVLLKEGFTKKFMETDPFFKGKSWVDSVMKHME